MSPSVFVRAVPPLLASTIESRPTPSLRPMDARPGREAGAGSRLSSLATWTDAITLSSSAVELVAGIARGPLVRPDQPTDQAPTSNYRKYGASTAHVDSGLLGGCGIAARGTRCPHDAPRVVGTSRRRHDAPPSIPHASHMSQIAPNVISRDLAPLERSLSEARLPSPPVSCSPTLRDSRRSGVLQASRVSCSIWRTSCP